MPPWSKCSLVLYKLWIIRFLSKTLLVMEIWKCGHRAAQGAVITSVMLWNVITEIKALKIKFQVKYIFKQQFSSDPRTVQQFSMYSQCKAKIKAADIITLSNLNGIWISNYNTIIITLIDILIKQENCLSRVSESFRHLFLLKHCDYWFTFRW